MISFQRNDKVLLACSMALVPVSDVQVLKTCLNVLPMVIFIECWKVNESFIKACRDGDLAKFADLVDRADVNYVSESGQSHQQ